MMTNLEKDDLRKILKMACELSCEAEVVLPDQIIEPQGFIRRKKQGETDDDYMERILVEPTAKVKLMELHGDERVMIEILTSCFFVPGVMFILDINSVTEIIL